MTTWLSAIIETFALLTLICFTAYGLFWLAVYYFEDLQTQRHNNRLHKQTYIIKERTKMKKEDMYNYLIEGQLKTEEPAQPTLVKDTYTKAEVNDLLQRKAEEIIESLRKEPDQEPDQEPEQEPVAE